MKTTPINVWNRRFSFLPKRIVTISGGMATSTITVGHYWERFGVPAQMRLPNPFIQRMSDKEYRSMWESSAKSAFSKDTEESEIRDFLKEHDITYTNTPLSDVIQKIISSSES